METNVLLRAQGCLLGQLAGDSLDGLVEFQSSEEIRRRYPNGLRELSDGGTWGTLAGQPTDDSEMALLLARMLVKVELTTQRPRSRLIDFGLIRIPLIVA